MIRFFIMSSLLFVVSGCQWPVQTEFYNEYVEIKGWRPGRSLEQESSLHWTVSWTIP